MYNTLTIFLFSWIVLSSGSSIAKKNCTSSCGSRICGLDECGNLCGNCTNEVNYLCSSDQLNCVCSPKCDQLSCFQNDTCSTLCNCKEFTKNDSTNLNEISSYKFSYNSNTTKSSKIIDNSTTYNINKTDKSELIYKTEDIYQQIVYQNLTIDLVDNDSNYFYYNLNNQNISKLIIDFSFSNLLFDQYYIELSTNNNNSSSLEWTSLQILGEGSCNLITLDDSSTKNLLIFNNRDICRIKNRSTIFYLYYFSYTSLLI